MRCLCREHIKLRDSTNKAKPNSRERGSQYKFFKTIANTALRAKSVYVNGSGLEDSYKYLTGWQIKPIAVLSRVYYIVHATLAAVANSAGRPNRLRH